MIVYLKGREYDARGEYDIDSRELTVLKGSKVSQAIHSSETFSTAKIENYRKQYVKGSIVKEDVLFRSSSTAANFVTGNSSNGLIAWKTEDGKSLREYLK